MAEEEAQPEGEAPAEGEAPKESKGAKIKAILMVLLPKLLIPIVSLLGGLAGAGMVFVLVKNQLHQAPPAEISAEDPTAETPSEEKKPPEEAPKPEGEHKAEEKPAAKEGEHAKEGEAAKEGEHAKEGEAPPPADHSDEGGITVKFDPLVVNIAEKNSIHYLKLQMEFKVDGEDAVAEIDQHKAQIRDQLVFIFSDMSLREVLSTGGKVLLKENIMASLNKILTKGKVLNVYFTDFTVQ